MGFDYSDWWYLGAEGLKVDSTANRKQRKSYFIIIFKERDIAQL